MTWITFVHVHTFIFRYTIGNENTLTVEVEQDMTFQLQEEISKSSEELSKIYSSLVRDVKINDYTELISAHSIHS